MCCEENFTPNNETSQVPQSAEALAKVTWENDLLWQDFLKPARWCLMDADVPDLIIPPEGDKWPAVNGQNEEMDIASIYLGFAVRNFQTNATKLDCVLFLENIPVAILITNRERESIIEAVKENPFLDVIVLKWQSRYYRIRFVFETEDHFLYYTDYDVQGERQRKKIKKFPTPEELRKWLPKRMTFDAYDTFLEEAHEIEPFNLKSYWPSVNDIKIYAHRFPAKQVSMFFSWLLETNSTPNTNEERASQVAMKQFIYEYLLLEDSDLKHGVT